MTRSPRYVLAFVDMIWFACTSKPEHWYSLWSKFVTIVQSTIVSNMACKGTSHCVFVHNVKIFRNFRQESRLRPRTMEHRRNLPMQRTEVRRSDGCRFVDTAEDRHLETCHERVLRPFRTAAYKTRAIAFLISYWYLHMSNYGSWLKHGKPRP